MVYVLRFDIIIWWTKIRSSKLTAQEILYQLTCGVHCQARGVG